MPRLSIREKCKINTNYSADTFVGIQSVDGDISINFPVGFNLSDDDKGLRRDIILLMNGLRHHTSREESTISNDRVDDSTVEFPFEAYLAVLADFFGRGYFKENEVAYNFSKRGKINWNRTIKNCKPVIQNNTVYYLDFVTKRSRVNDDELITLIHEFCVYESFEKVGWIFTSTMPKQPRIKYNYRLFKGVLLKKISETFNDRNRELFNYMLAIVEYQGNDNPSHTYMFGTSQFEYVWESMIDRIYGIVNKSDYFPKTSWLLPNRYNNAVLKPDTIMVHNNDIFILDAKYYKFGYSRFAGDLPESASINKQITYGEYVAETERFREIHGEEMHVYNAFLLPFDSKVWNQDTIYRFGEAVGDWKTGDKTYEKIQGILVDVKSLMESSLRNEHARIKEMAELIERAVLGEEND